jgi:hypothetical protein
MIPLHWDHGTQPEDIIGHVDPAQMSVQSNGLVVGGRVDLDTDRGQQVWRLLKQNSLGFSFGFVVNESHVRSDGVREISLGRSVRDHRHLQADQRPDPSAEHEGREERRRAGPRPRATSSASPPANWRALGSASALAR